MAQLFGYKNRYWKVFKEFDTIGDSEEFSLDSGTYLLICYGAKGGATTQGGTDTKFGGASYGILTLDETTTLYACVGGNGEDRRSDRRPIGGFNGGGNGGEPYNTNYDPYGAAGGGATDFRLLPYGETAIVEIDGVETEIPVSLYSRLIVAGGGGGGGNAILFGYCGHGGGIVGGCIDQESAWTKPTPYPFPTQTSGYQFGVGQTPDKRAYYSRRPLVGYGGGGGGWYGGYSIINASSSQTTGDRCGCGGSGYVFTESSYKPGDEYGVTPDPKYYLTDTFMVGRSAIEPKAYVCVPVSGPNIGDVITFPCVGWTEEMDLYIGTYRVKCYGGRGGTRQWVGTSGAGGYAEGVFHNPEIQKMYVTVGGSGTAASIPANGYPDYNKAYKPTLCFNGGGLPTGYGSLNSGGTAAGGASDVRIGTNSLFSRIIVAGGAGGAGYQGKGGVGGGSTGGWDSYSSSKGTQAGPGTQTGSPSTDARVQGSFGKGGNALYLNNGYGGAGGGGWYGGSGTVPDGSQDNDRGGSGGSGFVYTSESAINVPSDYQLDSRYYMTDTVLTAGGNDLEGDQTMIEIEVIDITYMFILARDSEGFKRYDSESDSWVWLSSTLPSVEDFMNYGVYDITSDDGLLNAYDLYMYSDTSNADTANVRVTPNQQRIRCDTESKEMFSTSVMDYEYDPFKFDVSYETKRIGVGEDAHAIIYVTMDKLTKDESRGKIFSLSAISYSKGTCRYIPPKPEETNETVVNDDPSENKFLLSAGIVTTTIPNTYVEYLGTYNGQSFSSVPCTVSCEHNRMLYMILTLKTSSFEASRTLLRFMQINLLTGEKKILRDQEVNNTFYIGGIAVDDENLYYTQAADITQRTLYRLSLNNMEGQTSKFSPQAGDNYNFAAFGKLEWFDDHTLCILCKGGVMFFDTNLNTFTYSSIYSSANSRRDMVVGKKYILSMSTANNTGFGVYNIEEDSWFVSSDVIGALPGDASTIAGCYSNGKFYIVKQSSLVVIDEDTFSIIKSYTTPWTSINTCGITKDVVYINTSTSRYWIFDLTNESFDSIYMPWTPPTLAANAVHRYTCFDGYQFVPVFQLAKMNYVAAFKYAVGYKYDNYEFLFGDINKDKCTYDDRFVKFYESYMSLENGDIPITMQTVDPLDPTIHKITLSKNLYKFIVGISFTKESDDNDGEEETNGE